MGRGVDDLRGWLESARLLTRVRVFFVAVFAVQVGIQSIAGLIVDLPVLVVAGLCGGVAMVRMVSRERADLADFGLLIAGLAVTGLGATHAAAAFGFAYPLMFLLGLYRPGILLALVDYALVAGLVFLALMLDGSGVSELGACASLIMPRAVSGGVAWLAERADQAEARANVLQQAVRQLTKLSSHAGVWRPVADAVEELLKVEGCTTERFALQIGSRIVGVSGGRDDSAEPVETASMAQTQDLGRGMLITQLRNSERPVGALVLSGLEGPDEELRDSLKALCDAAATALERLDLEEGLRRSESRFRTLVQNATDLVFIVGERRRLTYISPSVTRVFGPDVRVGTPIDALLHPEDRNAFLTALTTARAIRGVADPFQCRWKHDLVFETVIRDLSHDPTVGGVVLNARDITERVATAAALEDTEARFRQAQKLEAVGQLAGGIAHDFNNLLSVIQSYAELLSEDFPPSDPRREDLGEIRGAASRAAELTRQLLTFSRRTVLNPEVCTLEDVVSGVDRMLRRVVGEDIEVVVEAGEAVPVRVDRGLMEQVLLNLVVNARDAMPDGGIITIRTGSVPGSGRRLARLWVDDTGPGVPDELIDNIFEPFYTTKEVGRGTGLGLAMVYGFIQQSHGRITVGRAPGGGARFEVVLPETAVKRSERTAPIQRRPPRGYERILLVEDETSVRRVASRILRELGYDVLVANDGEQALDMVGDLDVHLVLTDVVMPRMGGVELAEKVKENQPDAQVLYMSGYSEQRHSVPARDLLAKPFTPAALARRVRRALDGTRPSLS